MSRTSLIAELLTDEGYEQQTCGMAIELVARVRAAHRAQHNDNDPQPLHELCNALLQSLPGDFPAAMLVAPPMGTPTCVVARGEAPYVVVVWMLLDPLDIDSKQTTFLHLDAMSSTPYTSSTKAFEALYKLH